MIDREKVLRGLECCTSTDYTCRDDCPYDFENGDEFSTECMHSLIEDAFELIQTYQQLLEWAVECGFGYDHIPDLYEQYKDEIEGMSYTDGLLYLASRSLEKGKSNV